MRGEGSEKMFAVVVVAAAAAQRHKGIPDLRE
jgi:hypothetical protein